MQSEKLVTLLGRSTLEHPKGRTSLLQIHSREDANNGFNGVFDKHHVVGEIVHGQQRRDIHLFEKDALGRARTYYNTYLEAKRAGISVPDSMRALDESRVVMTDYSRQGVVFFGKEMCVAYKNATKDIPLPEALSYIERLPLKSIQTFLNATHDMEEIAHIVNDYSKRATSAGLLLPYDEMFEIVTWPNGTWKVMLLDLHTAKTGYHGFALEESNRVMAQDTIHMYTYMRKIIDENYSR